MEYLGSCRWFNDVHWEEPGSVVDCLVDLSQELSEGHFLVEQKGRLRIIIVNKLNLNSVSFLTRVVGKAIKWSRNL